MFRAKHAHARGNAPQNLKQTYGCLHLPRCLYHPLPYHSICLFIRLSSIKIQKLGTSLPISSHTETHINMPRPKKEVKVEKEPKPEESADSATTSLRRSSRSTRGSLKPIVDLAKVEKEIEEVTEEKPKRQVGSTSRKSVRKEHPDSDIVDLVDMSDKSDDDEQEISKERKNSRVKKNVEEVAVEDEDEERGDDVDEEEAEEEDDDEDDEDFEEPQTRRSSRGRKSSVAGTSGNNKKTNKKAGKQGVTKKATTTISTTTTTTKPSNKKTPARASKTDKKSTDHDNGRSAEVEILYQLDEKEMKEINQAFDMNCSQDGEEQLSSEDLKTAIRSLGFEPRADEIQKLVEKFSNRNGTGINRDGFHKIMAFKLGSAPGRHDNSSNDEISKVFNLLDLDKTGMITMENLRSISKELNEDITDEELHEMIAEADFDGDLMINKQEFYNIMKKTSLY